MPLVWLAAAADIEYIKDIDAAHIQMTNDTEKLLTVLEPMELLMTLSNKYGRPILLLSTESKGPF